MWTQFTLVILSQAISERAPMWHLELTGPIMAGLTITMEPNMQVYRLAFPPMLQSHMWSHLWNFHQDIATNTSLPVAPQDQAGKSSTIHSIKTSPRAVTRCTGSTDIIKLSTMFTTNFTGTILEQDATWPNWCLWEIIAHHRALTQIFTLPGIIRAPSTPLRVSTTL